MRSATQIALCFFTMAVLIQGAVAQSRMFLIHGTVPESGYGERVAGIGDVDLDGTLDFAVGQYGPPGGTHPGRVIVYSGSIGTELFTVLGSNPGDLLGMSVSGAGDVDADGVPDLIGGAPGSNGNTGSALIISGRTRQTIHTVLGSSAGDRFGHSVSRLGDLDGDGCADVLIGAPQGSGPGYAMVISGRTGSPLLTVSGISGGDLFGNSVAGVGDVNIDGVPDFVVGAHEEDSNGRNSGSAYLFSGASGFILHQWAGGGSDHIFGAQVAAAGDVNGDSVPDVIVAAPYDHSVARYQGSVQVFSGANGAQLLRIDGPGAQANLGWGVAGIGDFNRDGHDDLAISAAFSGGNEEGVVSIYSGLDGSILASITGENAQDHLVSVAGLGDLTGDGTPDFVVGATAHGTGRTGYVKVMAAEALALTTDVHTISAAIGGTQILSLCSGPAHQNDLYLVLGSMSGTSPGVPLPIGTLPLNVDVYFMITATAFNTGIFRNTWGTLGAGGTAHAAIVVPAGFPELVGLTLHHAYVDLKLPGSVGLDFVSNAVPLTFVQ